MLSIGDIIHIFCDFTNPPKNKFLVIVQTNPLLCMFIINSEINDFLMKRPELLKAQIKITPVDYSFLNHDSYIACHELIDSFFVQDIENMLKADPSCLKGKINADTKAKIVDAISNSRLFSLEERRDLLKSLMRE